jgi:hypothetical protein
MRGLARRRFFVADVSIVAAVAVITVLLAALTGGGSPAVGPRTTVRVPAAAAFANAPSVPYGFVGLSLEYSAVEQYAGGDPSAIDPVLVSLIRNLNPSQRPVIRIGGDSTDWTWWPVAGMSRPPGVTFTLGPRWVAVTKALATKLDARLILGINFEADSGTVAATESRELLNGIGTQWVRALELGNEPELYGAFGWYRTASGKPVTGRPSSYDFSAFKTDFASIAQALPPFRLAGPAISGPGWMKDLPAFLQSEPRLGLVTLHRYPLQSCFVGSHSPRYPSIAHLLSGGATAGLASVLAPPVAEAHARHLRVRIDELNTVSCGPNRRVSGSFAAALWATDALFELAHAGIDGVNIHTFPGAGYELFKMSQHAGNWGAAVSPEYYGLLLFARAAPAGSRLIPMSSADRAVKVWGTEDGRGVVRITAINKDQRSGHQVRIEVQGAHGSAELQRLLGSGAEVTLGGASFGAQTESGTLASHPDELAAAGAGYTLDLPPSSAALLTLPEHRG